MKKKEIMKNVPPTAFPPGQKVMYIGGQDKLETLMYFPKEALLDKNKVYTVLYPCYGKFLGGWKPAIYLEEKGIYAYLMEMFKPINLT